MTEKFKQHVCVRGLKYKEETGVWTGLAATTHPDRVGDILSLESLHQMKGFINDTATAGGENGAYRSVSLYHDWIKEGDATLDEAGFLLPNARVVSLNEGHHGLEVDVRTNKFYKGSITADEINFRIENGSIAGLSIEYDTDDNNSRNIEYGGQSYRFIESLTEFGGVGYARGRLIANPHAVIYKEIAQKAKEVINMTEQKTKDALSLEEREKALVQKEKALADKEAEIKTTESKLEKSKETEVKEVIKKVETKLDVKELLENKEFMDAVEAKLQVKNKVMKNKEGTESMEISLSVKEMNDALSKSTPEGNFQYKEAVSRYLTENPQFEQAFMSSGIPLRTTMSVKCDGTKLRITSKLGLQTKDVLDTTTNTTAYTQSIVEFADLYLPTIIETFNQQTTLFGQLQKRGHLMGGDQYGWRIKTDQATSLSVDPDDVTVVKNPVDKLKLRTQIKEYRVGVSVTDFLLHHGRAAIGDILMIEVEARMRDLMKDLNGDLFTEQVDTAGNQVLGLEAVADSAGNVAMYGVTRSAANRLAPDTASDTYNAVGGALTTALVRQAARLVEVEGALRSDLRIIVNPNQRDALFELETGNQRYFDRKSEFGFDGGISYDGIQVIVDVDCQTDALFVVDWSGYYAVISRAPQMIGLAKLGAAQEAFISMYLAIVYEQPRRVHMLDTLA